MKNKKSIRLSPIDKHSKHQVEIKLGQGPHAGQYWCLECNHHIAWISKSNLLKLRNDTAQ